MFKAIIIDDEKIARETLKKYCMAYAGDFEIVRSFSNSPEALKYLEKNDVDVVFTDVKMPDITGIDIAKWIYENKPYIKVIMVSGYGEFQYAQEAIRYKVLYYLLKVIDPDEFKEMMKRLKNELLKKKDIYKNNQIELEMFFYDVLCNMFESREEIIDKFSQLCTIPAEKAVCKILTIKFKDLYIFLKEKWHYDADMFNNAITNIIKVIHNQCFVMNIKDEDEYKYLLLFSQENQIGLSDEEIEKKITETIGIGTEVIENYNKSFFELCDPDEKTIVDEEEKVKLINSHELDEKLNKKSKFIDEVIEYINRNFETGILKNDVAKHFNMNRDYLGRQFKEITGKGISEYMFDLRMERAVYLIGQNINADKVCKMIGYNDTRSFRRLFRKYTGKTIQEYRDSENKD